MNQYTKCPDCGKHDSVPIAYGFPSDALFEAVDRGEVVLGGCDIGGVIPMRACKLCGCQFHFKELVPGLCEVAD